MADKGKLDSIIEHLFDRLHSYFDGELSDDDTYVYGWEESNFDLGKKILNSKAFRTTVQAYYEIDNNTSPKGDEGWPSDAPKKSIHLLNLLNPYYQVDAKHIKDHETMEKSGALEEAIAHLHEAAEILKCISCHYDDISDSDFEFDILIEHLDHPPYGIDDALLNQPLNLRHKIELKLPVDMGTKQGLETLFVYNLLGKSIERIANGVKTVFKDGFEEGKFPPYYKTLGYSVDNVGTRGAASDNKAATRGLFIKELNNLVPERVLNRFAVIAELAQLGGHENVDRHLVRSILKQGHT